MKRDLRKAVTINGTEVMTVRATIESQPGGSWLMRMVVARDIWPFQTDGAIRVEVIAYEPGSGTVYIAGDMVPQDEGEPFLVAGYNGHSHYPVAVVPTEIKRGLSEGERLRIFVRNARARGRAWR